MKKLSYLLTGAFIGAAVMLTTSVYGADIAALVGKKVQGETEIVVAGIPVEKAIIIDGKSYAPVRSIAEMGGFEVDFVDKKILMNQKDDGESASSNNGAPDSVTDDSNVAVANELDELNQKISDKRKEVDIVWEQAAQIQHDAIRNQTNPTPEKVAEYNKLKAEHEKLSAELAELEAQKAELE
ncbi:hypothetical protein [Paenibacillus daejeonensis]|uniref:hypothetical protein n=1 Tax=Paenibacillus daejeonensis TaxID=135193 RepID=UPI00036C1109|nr:hypothetical protein [Paenibacillus daejeonensis]